ncbi:cysteine--tRNA ligase [Scatolibacter rhodanostii]|uniref:cysteine--tRNA ligase n=1 Tax=Scatolibacter rhodanostii TaxID=2014781 RepID=UPI000C06C2C1|nr:cysteine--tRNA ligase [Scatolibacter rhodanostii]
MKIFNSLTRQKEEFVPLKAGEATIYACGPTVYNLMHVGNARQICVFDTLRRYFEFRGIKVTYAQNFTDIDDKIINRANEEGTDYLAISRKYIEEYFIDAHGLNIRDADIHPKATENIQEIIEIISVLIEKGYAYATESGDVYFSTAHDEYYGKLSHQPLEDLKAGARITAGEEKREPVDFAVWKSAKPGEPYWDSPWGKGRPGWHIECSAMVRHYFGKTIDIHGGGQDLIFPHHENEIAQSECCNDAELANYWVHNGHVNVDNKKMSKSLGNFFTVREVADKYGYESIRYLMISSHYRSPMNYSVESIEQAVASLERLYNCRDNLLFLLEKAESGLKDGEKEIEAQLLSYQDKFIAAMDDDLNTADAVSAIFELAREINTKLNLSTMPSKELCQNALNLFLKLNDTLGILYKSDESELDKEIEALIQKRNEARKNKDWATADAIRDELTQRKIVLEDTPSGIKWRIQS